MATSHVYQAPVVPAHNLPPVMGEDHQAAEKRWQSKQWKWRPEPRFAQNYVDQGIGESWAYPAGDIDR
jgi:hypothetical protein